MFEDGKKFFPGCPFSTCHAFVPSSLGTSANTQLSVLQQALPDADASTQRELTLLVVESEAVSKKQKLRLTVPDFPTLLARCALVLSVAHVFLR